MSVKLTIAIPTYNRNEKAVKQIRCLLQQIQEADQLSLELLVIDNASDIPVSTSLTEAGLIDQLSLSVIRNPANIGLSGNILRCFEHAQGEWVWLVGDDDEILPTALKQVHVALKDSALNVVLHKFAVERKNQTETKDRMVNSLSEMCEYASDPWCFSNLLFITTSVYRRSRCIPYLSTAYHWNASVAPHLVCLFSALRDGGAACIQPHKIAKVVPATGTERWNQIRVRMGLQTLSEIEGCELEVHRLFNALVRRWYGGWKFPIISMFLCLRSNRPASFWKKWYFRAASSTSGFQPLYQALLAIFWTPIGCSRLMRSLVSRMRGERDDNAGTERM